MREPEGGRDSWVHPLRAAVPSSIFRDVARHTMPAGVRRWARRGGLAVWPPRGTIRFGTLRRQSPISSCFGFDRGTPVDRYYIERFLREHVQDVRGCVLEVGDDRYTRLFGGVGIKRLEVLNLDPARIPNEIVDDLARPQRLSLESYDCVICTQTLQFIYDFESAVVTLRQILRPGGTALVTVPGISRVSRDDREKWHDCWRFTCFSSQRLFASIFGDENVEVRAYGNVLASIGFLHGVAAEELRPAELDFRDDAYDLVICVRARRAERDEQP